MKWKLLVGKLLVTPLVVFFVNGIFVFLQPQVFASVMNLITIVLLNLFFFADLLIRPPVLGGEKDRYKATILVVFFLVCPLLVYMPYLEFTSLLKQNISSILVSILGIIGIITLVCGGIVLITSRIIIGSYGSPKIIIKEQHKLITRGPYRYIRHPIYLGDLLLFFGYALAFGSIISPIVILVILFSIFKSRMNMEEKLLLETFGEEYKEYMARTKRLIPFVF